MASICQVSFGRGSTKKRMKEEMRLFQLGGGQTGIFSFKGRAGAAGW